MTKLEKVINGLEHCTREVTDAFVNECSMCPYKPTKDNEKDCFTRTQKDALELLKEREPIPCGEKIKAGDVILDFYECGYCKNAIRKPWKYCPFCGKEVKWDG